MLEALCEFYCIVSKIAFFGVIANGSLSLSRDNEQVAICFRYCDENLEMYEESIGLYVASKFDAEALTSVIVDAVRRLGLDFLILLVRHTTEPV